MGDQLDAYPKRPPYFACKFVRRMGKVCLANDIGPDACWLLAFIVSTEDAKSYRAPVSFYNEDLATRTGLSLAGMKRARDRAVEAGWLHYVKGAKGRAARYFVRVPKWADQLDDGPGDEEPGELSGAIVAQAEPESVQNPDGIRTECEPPSSLTLTLPPLASSVPDSAGRAKKPRKEKTPRPPNLLFDAVREVTGTDAEVDRGHLGKVAAAFAKASPPVTPEDVRDFAARWREAFRWATPDQHPQLTIGIIQKHMTAFRGWRSTHGPPAPVDVREERRRELLALVKKDVYTREEAELKFGGPLDVQAA